MNKALLSSNNQCWCTPQDFYDKLNAEFNFVLDPAATDKTAKCSLYYTPERTGYHKAGIVAAQYSAIHPTGVKLVNGLKRLLKRQKVVFQLFYLSPRGRTQHIFTITFTGKRKSASFARGYDLLMMKEILLGLRRFHQW